MKTEQVQKVLEGESGVKSETKGTYVVADDVDLTVLLDMGQEPLSVARVRKLTLAGDLVTLETHKGDRVHTSAAIRALKISQSDPSKMRGAGFTAQR
jgi:hypothetical protein